MRNYAILAIVAFTAAMALLLSVSVYADQAAQAERLTSGYNSVTAANAVLANGSNVTSLNLTSAGISTKWQGYYGNVSGSLALGDGTDTFYSWSGVTFQGVFATLNSSTPVWADVSGINGAGALNTKDTEFSFTNTDSDSITNTFTGTTCSAGSIITGAAGVFTLNGSQEQSVWQTCIGEQFSGALDATVFGTNVTTGNNSFKNGTAQYQMMVAVDDGVVDNYYFYLEV